ncbi:MAG: MBL fold metallo-hydrolase [Deltaproteobacteria bacterium]|nr:MBL fold metallo-hydrolase [Deltaproteobacteria bacterium]NNK08204.1 MBL fold metallo-hydrolase [Myxococcales bacterium]NNK42312.1 MBL fold metallo-hydrolase [Myxococcales bacterium]
MSSEPLYRSRPGGHQIQPASQPEATRINDFIYLSEGLSNAFLIATPEGRIVVNTGMGFEAPIHKRNFDAVDDGPVRYILFTQGHVDHVGGADLFREDGTKLVAHANNQAHQADDSRISAFRAMRSGFAFAETIAKAFQYIQQNMGGSIPPQSRPTPDITFDDRLELELGGLRMDLLWTPGGETTDSMVISLPDHEIVFTGNLFSALFGHFPNLVTIRGDRYREALVFIESLERVRALEPEILLPGHGGPVVGKETIQEELIRLRDAVQYVHDETVKGMNHGKAVHSLMREIQLPPELEVGQGYGKVSWSVRAIWETYAGWFHHSSTTELYDVPQRAVHGDLVELAGGTDAIAERAASKLEAGEPVEAIHLAEVALSADATNVAAVEVMIAAHEKLESESENFWLTQWLRKQLADHRGTLGAAKAKKARS